MFHTEIKTMSSSSFQLEQYYTTLEMGTPGSNWSKWPQGRELLNKENHLRESRGGAPGQNDFDVKEHFCTK